MGPTSRETWAQRLGTFRASPSAFMAGPEGEDLGRNLLSDLRSEKLSEPTKVSLLALSLEYPAQLWPDAPAAEVAATSLLDTLVLLPPRPSALRRPLLLAATTALAAGDSRLLLRLEAAQADGVPVALRTDDWAVLPLVGDYLRGLSAAG